jgi:hypothetical protein
MIPEVETILRMLKAGECTHEQAMAWMDEHFTLAMEEERSKYVPQPVIANIPPLSEADIAELAKPGQIEVVYSESARLKWLEDKSTMHERVDILYVVDGYEVQVMHEDGVTELSPRFHGTTLGEAIDAALKCEPSA